jgi:CSLREA domain-containing protein
MPHRPILLSFAALGLAALACSYEDGLDILEGVLEGVPTELTVTKTEDTDDGFCTLDDCSLREAILVANDRPGPDQIYVPAGLYQLTLSGEDNLGHVGDLDVSGDVQIRGDGWTEAGTVIDGIGQDRIFEILSGATAEIRTLVVRNGAYVSNAGIVNAGHLTLHEVLVSGNHADAIGGGIGNGGELHLEHVLVTGNTAGAHGGGIYNYLDALVWIEDGSEVVSNTAATYGGGVYALAGGIVYVTDSMVGYNTAITGAGLFIGNGSAAQLERAEVLSNDGYARGGGIYSEGVVDVVASRFEGNDANHGGALASNAEDGGDGAAIYGSTFVGNQGSTASAIASNGALALRESMVSANIGGTAILNDRWSSFCNLDEMLLENVTVSGNLPWPGTTNPVGVVTSCPLALRFSTIAGHAGTGVWTSNFYAAEAPTLHGVLLADNGANCNEAVASAGSNLSSDASCVFTATTDLSDVDPGLEPLADNGGSTLTHALAADSPALDAASGDCPPVDQRGVTRPQGPGCDIGAFEAEGSLPRLVTTPTSSATPSPTIGPATVTVDLNANCRSGPGTVYPVLTSAAAGAVLPIVGRDSNGSWWVVQLGAYECWITAGAVTASGDLATVPVRPAPPPPTATTTPEPSATPTFVLIVSVAPKWTPTAIP